MLWCRCNLSLYFQFNRSSDSFLYYKQAIDKLPLIPGVLEFIGILFSSVRTQYIFDIVLKSGDREENFKSCIHYISPIEFVEIPKFFTFAPLSWQP